MYYGKILTAEQETTHPLAIHCDVLFLPHKFLPVIVDNLQFGLSFSMFFLPPVLVPPVMTIFLSLSVFMFTPFLLTVVIHEFFFLIFLFPFVA